MFPGDNTVMCPRCGDWRQIIRKVTTRECNNLVLGLPMEFVPDYPDEPPFLFYPHPHMNEGR